MAAGGLVLIVLCVVGGGLVLVIGATILAVYFINKDYPRDN
jgi:hypothetical protein